MIRSVAWRARTHRVLALLEEQRALIRAGDLVALAEHAPRSQAAIEEFTASVPPETAGEELRRVQEAAQRNQRLLSALLGGVAEAKREIGRQVEAGRRLGYDRSGAAVARGAAPGRDCRA